MQLLVFRHGIAEDRRPDSDDASRRLTDEGVSKTKEAARGLARIAPRPATLLSSPLVRAWQTAQIAGQVFEVEPRVLDSLAHGPPLAVARDVRARREDVVMIVGHEPTLSRLIALLCTGAGPMDCIQLKKAGCACVELDTDHPERPATLLWLATPKMLRDLQARG